MIVSEDGNSESDIAVVAEGSSELTVGDCESVALCVMEGAKDIIVEGDTESEMEGSEDGDSESKTAVVAEGSGELAVGDCESVALCVMEGERDIIVEGDTES